MSPTSDEITNAFARSAVDCLAECLERIRHCVGQLSDEEVWWRPREEMNAIGNLILHLCGNARQWMIAGLSGAADVRDRPTEFRERTRIPKDELLAQLEQTVAEATAVLQSLTAESLLRSRRVQGFERDGFGIVFHSVPHFSGHTQEIVFLTRMQLGEGYQFHWEPKTPEQGAPSE